MTTGHNRLTTYAGYVIDSFADATLVVDFLNTVNVDQGTDVLSRGSTWAQWAAQRSLRPDTLESARSARAALRAAAGDPSAETSRGAPRLVVPARMALGDDGPALLARDAVGAVLAAAIRLNILGEWDRIKICPADDCRWAFHDRSRNRSRAWCSMRVCGNREKARAWRGRR